MPSLFHRSRSREPDHTAQGDDAAVSGRAGHLQPSVTASQLHPNTKTHLSDRLSQPQKAAVGAKDLWSEAFECLSQQEREALRPRDGTPNDAPAGPGVIDEVVDLTEAKYKDYCQRGWHTKRGDTTAETNVRIRAKEIMCSALQFKDIVDAGLKFDPSGYGTIVWGVVSGALTLIQNDKQVTEAVFDSAAVMARYLPKYAIIESHYRDQPTQEQKVFEDQIQQVYVAILKYAVVVKKGLNRSVAGRLMDSFWTLDSQDITSAKGTLHDKDSIVSDQSQLVAHMYRKREFAKLDAQAGASLNKIDITIEKLLEGERVRTLTWLSDAPPTDKQQQLRSQVDRVNPDSGKWLLGSPEYTGWLKTGSSFMWLYGASGCGKSSLCSTLVKALLESAENEKDEMIVAYWYFDNSDAPTQSLQRLLRYVLRRVSAKARPLPEPVRALANEHELQGTSPSTPALVAALQQTATILDQKLVIVLDAIDEFQAGNDTLREELFDFLVSMGNAQAGILRLLVTSIPDSSIEATMQRLSCSTFDIDIEEAVSVDVDAFLHTKIERYAQEKHWVDETKEKIYKALQTDGRFRMVSLQLEELHRCYDDEEIVTVLSSIPRDVEDAYSRKLHAVMPKDVRRLSRIFSWIAVAVRQLTATELAAAPGVSLPHSAELLRICPSGFIRIDNMDDASNAEEHNSTPASEATVGGVATFDHPSIKRFLCSTKVQRSGDDQIAAFFISEDVVNRELTATLLDVLLQNSNSPQAEGSPFFSYAAQHWHEHMRVDQAATTGEIRDEKVVGKLSSLFAYPMIPAYLDWIRAWNPESNMPDASLTQDSCPSPLYMALFLGLSDIASQLIEGRHYINAPGGRMHTALQLALQRGYTHLVRALLTAGEIVDRAAAEQPTPLYTAVKSGNVELVRILLAAHANPDTEYGSSGNAIQVASLQSNTPVVEALISAGADVNAKSGVYGTALQAAATVGCVDVVRILLSHGADPDAKGGLLRSAIQAAATGQHHEIVKMLVDKGVPWNEETDSTWHEAYGLLRDESSSAHQKVLESLFSLRYMAEEPVGDQILLARMLRWDFISRSPGQQRSKTEGKYGRESSKSGSAMQSRLIEQIQERMAVDDTSYSVHRALFWALLSACAASLSQSRNAPEELWAILNRLQDLVALQSHNQPTIEHSSASPAAETARRQLVQFYALALKVAMEVGVILSRMTMSKIRFMMKGMSGLRRLEDLMEQLQQQGQVVGVAAEALRAEELQELAKREKASDREALDELREEMREGFRKLEERMLRREAETEERFAAFVRDVMPAIVREEVRKLLLEKEGRTGN